ncbi:hypothetical protein GCM10007854_18950 [Algimonas porphyrae]|uniref:Uncharacterized protein n=1 Tax=Algimonas porphyrae TaxID=1128113 RepID=A0ABQ5V062_9PROT|nr:hypothetical protein GCM10007854_18950 [Algimonas porphyrae]
MFRLMPFVRFQKLTEAIGSFCPAGEVIPARIPIRVTEPSPINALNRDPFVHRTWR